MLETFNGFGLQKQDDNVTKDRNIYVGGSDVPTILGINKYKTQYQLAQEKLGIIENEFQGNAYTTYGNQLEPQIRDYINSVNEMSFIVNTYHDEEKSIRSNVDGIDLETMTLLEIKTHGKQPKLEVYKAQMQLYMAQTGCEMGWLALYERPENFDTDFNNEQLEIVEVPADKDYQEKILDSIETFWVRVEYLREKPDMTEIEFMTIGTTMDVALMKLNKLAPNLIRYKEFVKHLEDQEKQLKEMLYQNMEENDVKKIETPFFIVTRVLPSQSKRFDSKKFKEDHPDIYEKYQTTSNRKGYIKLTERNDK
ncbi:lambda-exonuclease family protein [Facklamia sp. P12950]|uniref:lambda-exonuclease family protein n=1 Tax=Facklamia sp. P12950 TaxID=3421951 RepID=UPI003D180912